MLKRSKRILCLLLVAALLIGLFPASALATDTYEGEPALDVSATPAEIEATEMAGIAPLNISHISLQGTINPETGLRIAFTGLEPQEQPITCPETGWMVAESSGTLRGFDAHDPVTNPNGHPVPANIVIPQAVAGVRITAIADNMLQSRDEITSVTIGGHITRFGEGAFTNNENLTGLTFPDGVPSGYVQDGQGRLFADNGETLIYVPFGSMTGNLVLPLGVTRIGNRVFFGGNNTGNLIIPDGVTGFGLEAFMYNGFTGSLVIPDSVTSIGIGAFMRNSFNGTLTLGNSIVTISANAFRENNFTDNLVIPDSVTSVGTNAFLNNSFNGILTLGNSVETIGNDAFRSNSFTSNLAIPDSVTSVGVAAFMENSFNGTLTLGNSVETIGNHAFRENNFTGSLAIPDSVVSVGSRAFDDNSFDGILTLGNSVETIGDQAFANNNFTGNLVIPDSVTLVGVEAFRYSGFDGGTLTLGNALVTIADNAFRGNNLTGILVIPDSVISVGRRAFMENSFSGTLSLRSSLLTIGDEAFRWNAFAGNLIIPNSVISVGYFAFANNSFVEFDSGSTLHEFPIDFYRNTGAERVVVGKNTITFPEDAFNQTPELERVMFAAGSNDSIDTTNLEQLRDRDTGARVYVYLNQGSTLDTFFQGHGSQITIRHWETVTGAMLPTVGDPVDVTATVGQTATLNVSASAVDGGNLTFQWYRGSTAITGATDATLTIYPVAFTDGGYYHVVVTNTRDGATESVTSQAARLTVIDIVNAVYPVIREPYLANNVFTGHPRGYTMAVDRPLGGLSVTLDPAGIPAGHTRTFQWFIGGTAIQQTNETGVVLPNGAATLAAWDIAREIDNSVIGTHYFYVVITHRLPNATGEEWAEAISDPAAITIVPIRTTPDNLTVTDNGDGTGTVILSNDRPITLPIGSSVYDETDDDGDGTITIILPCDTVIILPALNPDMGGIFGQVTRAANGTGIGGATVIALNDAGREAGRATTNAGGAYYIANLDPDAGPFTLVVIRAGYVSQTRGNVVVAADEWTTESFELTAGGGSDFDDVTLVAIVTGASADSVVATGGVPLVEIENSSVWVVHTPAELTGTVVASATDYADVSATIPSPYDDGVAIVTLAFGLHTVTYRLYQANGAWMQTTEQVRDGNRPVQVPIDPQRDGYVFLRWADAPNGALVDPRAAAITADTYFYAVWINEDDIGANDRVVTFLMNDGTGGVFQRVVVPVNTAVAAPTVSPFRAGYNFEHWSTTDDGGAYVFTTLVTADMNLYAIWDYDGPGQPADRHLVRFVTGFIGNIEEMVVSGQRVSSVPVLTRPGDTFVRWEENGVVITAAEIAAATITTDRTFTAVWQSDLGDLITVTFVAGANGTLTGTTTIQVPTGTTLTAANVPTPVANTGFNFTSWAPSNPVGHTVTGAITFTAQFAQDGGGGPGPGEDCCDDYPDCNCDYEKHLAFMFGRGGNNFAPGENMTRAEFAAILVRTELRDFADETRILPPGMTSFTEFSDVNPNSWYFYYVAWAHDASMVYGFAGEFRPNDPITREEFAAMLVRAADAVRPAGNIPFADASNISDWARRYVYSAYREDLMIGVGGNNFAPRTYINRASAATAVNRNLGRIDSGAALAAADTPNLALAHDFYDVSTGAWYYASVIAAANDHRLTRDDDGAIDWKYIVRVVPSV